VGGKKPGSKRGGVDVVKAGLDIKKEGGDLQPGSLECLDPNLLSRGCPYIGVLPSTLALRDSSPRVTRLMTHNES